MGDKTSYPPDSWSLDFVISEFKKTSNSHLGKKRKILEDKLVSQYFVNKCLGYTEDPCLNYHNNQKPKHLIPLGCEWNYFSSMCNKQHCEQEKCPSAHTHEENLYHPDRFKKRYMHTY